MWDEKWGQGGKVFIVPGEGPSPWPSRRSFGIARENLARSKIPKYGPFMKGLSKTESGRIKKSALRDLPR
jgi:acyl-CoA synthetase (AMP-forming)/AMP-acid ligase II